MKPRDDRNSTTNPGTRGTTVPTDDLHHRRVALDEREATLTRRERALQEKETQAGAQARDLEERERQHAQARQALAQEDAVIRRRQGEAESTAGDIEKRARDIAERELEAEAGFARRNREALADLAREHEALRADLQQMRAQIATARVEGIQSIEAALASERQARMDALETEVAALRVRAGSEMDGEQGRERDRLTRARTEHDESIAAERARLAEDRKALEEESAKLHGEWTKVRWREEEIAVQAAERERSVEERARERVGTLDRQLKEMREDLDRALDARTAVEKRLDGVQQLIARFDGSPEEVLARLDDARKRIVDLEQQLLARPSESDARRLVELLELQRTWMDEREVLNRELAELKGKSLRWNRSVVDLEIEKAQKEHLEHRTQVLLDQIKKYSDALDQIRKQYDSPEERRNRVKSVEQPWRTDFKRAKDDDKLGEIDWLDRIIASCEAGGMRFPRRLVTTFHTSLKAAELSPLTVLAGVSGTGKSALPQLYSRFGGLAFLSLAVQPNWDSPQSLFGFFNSVDNRFSATSVLRAMIQAKQPFDEGTHPEGLADRLLLVLLDEMNLSHVELYFSDLLSRLEQRRGNSRDVSLEIDLGAGVEPYLVTLGRNVMWVGTMNEDETTKTLSDKVVDRSNLLYFPRPRTLCSRADVPPADEVPLLPLATWRRWLQVRSPFTQAELDPFRHALEEINRYLENVGRALGHRVWQAVEYYLANHPEVIDARAKNDPEAFKRAMRRAFEDQLVLRVMPKLRGIETLGNQSENCLKPIRKLLDNPSLAPGLADDFGIACKIGDGAFIWNSARYLENAE